MSEYISRDDGKIAAWQILEGMGYSPKHNDRLVEEVEAVFDDIPAADVRPVEWIPVTERRAEFPCICCDANGNLPFIPQGLLTITDAQGTWQIDAHLADPRLHQGKVKPVLGYGNRITHWMPLPEPPKAEEGE